LEKFTQYLHQCHEDGRYLEYGRQARRAKKKCPKERKSRTRGEETTKSQAGMARVRKRAYQVRRTIGRNVEIICHRRGREVHRGSGGN